MASRIVYCRSRVARLAFRLDPDLDRVRYVAEAFAPLEPLPEDAAPLVLADLERFTMTWEPPPRPTAEEERRMEDWLANRRHLTQADRPMAVTRRAGDQIRYEQRDETPPRTGPIRTAGKPRR